MGGVAKYSLMECDNIRRWVREEFRIRIRLAWVNGLRRVRTQGRSG